MPITEREKQELLQSLREKIEEINKKHAEEEDTERPLPPADNRYSGMLEVVCCMYGQRARGYICSCSYVTQCPIHGDKHWGSHD